MNTKHNAAHARPAILLPASTTAEAQQYTEVPLGTLRIPAKVKAEHAAFERALFAWVLSPTEDVTWWLSDQAYHQHVDYWLAGMAESWEYLNIRTLSKQEHGLNAIVLFAGTINFVIISTQHATTYRQYR